MRPGTHILYGMIICVHELNNVAIPPSLARVLRSVYVWVDIGSDMYAPGKQRKHSRSIPQHKHPRPRHNTRVVCRGMGEGGGIGKQQHVHFYVPKSFFGAEQNRKKNVCVSPRLVKRVKRVQVVRAHRQTQYTHDIRLCMLLYPTMEHQGKSTFVCLFTCTSARKPTHTYTRMHITHAHAQTKSSFCTRVSTDNPCLSLRHCACLPLSPVSVTQPYIVLEDASKYEYKLPSSVTLSFLALTDADGDSANEFFEVRGHTLVRVLGPSPPLAHTPTSPAGGGGGGGGDVVEVDEFHAYKSAVHALYTPSADATSPFHKKRALHDALHPVARSLEPSFGRQCQSPQKGATYSTEKEEVEILKPQLFCSIDYGLVLCR
jgi:hypothetical protein